MRERKREPRGRRTTGRKRDGARVNEDERTRKSFGEGGKRRSVARPTARPIHRPAKGRRGGEAGGGWRRGTAAAPPIAEEEAAVAATAVATASAGAAVEVVNIKSLAHAWCIH